MFHRAGFSEQFRVAGRVWTISLFFQSKKTICLAVTPLLPMFGVNAELLIDHA